MFITGTAPKALYQCQLLGLHPGAVALFITGTAPRSCSNIYHWECTHGAVPMPVTGTAPTALYQCRLLGLHPGVIKS